MRVPATTHKTPAIKSLVLSAVAFVLGIVCADKTPNFDPQSLHQASHHNQYTVSFSEEKLEKVLDSIIHKSVSMSEAKAMIEGSKHEAKLSTMLDEGLNPKIVSIITNPNSNIPKDAILCIDPKPLETPLDYEKRIFGYLVDKMLTDQENLY